MTNQLTNQKQPMPTFNESNQAAVAESSQTAQVNSNAPLSRQQAPLMQWFSDQPVRRKYLLGCLTSGVLSVAGIAIAGAWFATSVHQLQPTNQTNAAQPAEQQQRDGALLQLVGQQQLLALDRASGTNRRDVAPVPGDRHTHQTAPARYSNVLTGCT